MSEPKNLASDPANDVFTISRTFDADRDTMFKLWTEPDQLKHWWGPKGFTVQTAKMDLHPGGRFHYCLAGPDGAEMWGKFAFREVAKPKRLIFVNSFSDARGGTTRHPMNPDWPREIMSKVTMTEEAGKTTVTIEWSPLNPTSVERDTFRSNHNSMTQGWTGTFDQLATYIARQGKGE